MASSTTRFSGSSLIRLIALTIAEGFCASRSQGALILSTRRSFNSPVSLQFRSIFWVPCLLHLFPRAGTVISETWEDGQAIKDVNAHLRRLLESREAVERQRKSLKKKQPEDGVCAVRRVECSQGISTPANSYSPHKGDGTEAELGLSEEDIIIQDELYKSHLASIKREQETYVRERD